MGCLLLRVLAVMVGQASGLLIGLFAYYQLHRDGNTYLMSWRQLKQGEWRNDQNSATDGDLYIAQSLIMAAKLWPKAAGSISSACPKNCS